MNINGRVYRDDLKIFPDKIKADWWRDKGHLLQTQDIEDVISFHPNFLVIGQGYNGNMKIDADVKKKLEDEGIQFNASNTREVIHVFEKKRENNENVVGIFHLTC